MGISRQKLFLCTSALVALVMGCSGDSAKGDGPVPIVPPPDLAPGRVVGYVVDVGGAVFIRPSPEGATPVSGAEIVARNHEGVALGSAASDAGGRFEIGGLPPRLIHVEAFRSASGPVADATLEATLVPDVTIELGKSYPVARARAIELALAGVAKSSLVAASLNPLPAGVVAYPRTGPDGLPTSYLTELEADSWVILVDPAPTALFRHPVEYVLVDAASEALTRLPSADVAMWNHGGLWGSRDHWFVFSPRPETVDIPDASSVATPTAELVQTPEIADDPNSPSSKDVHLAPSDPALWDQIANIPVDDLEGPGLAPQSNFNNAYGDGVFVVLIRAGEEDLFRQDVNRFATSLFIGILDEDVPIANIAKMDLTSMNPPKYTATGNSKEDLDARTAAMTALLRRAVLHFEPQIEARLEQGMHSTLVVYVTGHGGGGEVVAQFANDQSGVFGISAATLPGYESKACRVRMIINACESGKVKDELAQRFQGTEHDVVVYSSTAPDENGLGVPGFLTYVPFGNLVKQGGSQFTTVLASEVSVENGDLTGLFSYDAQNQPVLNSELAELSGSPPAPFVRPSHPSWCFPGGSTLDSGVSLDAGDGAKPDAAADGGSEGGTSCQTDPMTESARLIGFLLGTGSAQEQCLVWDEITEDYFDHSSALLGGKPVAKNFSTLYGRFGRKGLFTEAQLTTLFGPSGPFPCGAGTNGLTLCPPNAGQVPAGDVITLSAVFHSPIPLSDAKNHFQYGFAFDSDGNSSNNYQANAQYPDDLFKNTDRWYEALHVPGAGWSLKVSTAFNGNIQTTASQARVVIKGNSMTLVLPISELTASAPYRLTAFRHTGDYGMKPPYDYDGSVWPLVSKPLAPPPP